MLNLVNKCYIYTSLCMHIEALRKISNLVFSRPVHSIVKDDYFDIIIAGGGMVGTTLACALAQAPKLFKKRILLLEGSPKKDWQLTSKYSNRVSALNPGTKKLLESIGAWEYITSTRFKAIKKMQVWEACSDAVITFDYDGMIQDVAYIVENDVLLNAVNTRAEDFLNNLTIVHEARIKKYHLPADTGGTAVQVEMENGTTYQCSLLVGADGANSKVRETMGVKFLSWNYNQMGVVATLKLSETTENNVAWQRFIPSGPVALLPLTDGLSSLVWSTSKSHAQELLKLSDENFVDALNEALWKRYPRDSLVDSATKKFNEVLESLSLRSNAVYQLPPSIASVEEKSRAAFPLAFGHATCYAAKGVVLIGDAAHRIHPLAGQGVNLGFGDVQCLTELLSEAVYSGASLGHLSHLLKYETLRQRHNVPTMLAVDGLQKLYGTNLTAVVMLRSLGLQLTHALSPVKKLIMEHAAV